MFHTDRLLLRALDPRVDTNVWTQWLNDVTMARAIRNSGARPASLEEVKDIVQRLSKVDNGLTGFAVCLKPSDQDMPAALPPNADLFVKDDGSARYPIIGCLNIRGAGAGVNFTNKDVAFGVGFSKEFRGQGFGEELVTWGCKYVFDVLGLHRVELESDATNAGALNCWRACGFVEEGRRRQALFIDGDWHDSVIFGMLSDDWKALKQRTHISISIKR